MTDKGTVAIDDLLGALENAKFEVVHVGTRYRITNPAGGAPAFIPHRIPKGAKLGPIVAGLKNIGFDLEQAANYKERQRLERLAQAKAEGDRLMAIAEAAAVARTNGTAKATPAKTVKAAPLTPAQRTGQYTEVVDLTPAQAEEWLKANRFYDPGATHAGSCNRKYRPNLASEYAAMMLRGEWKLTNQGIGFDTNGDLADGQHRLGAVVLAGLTRPNITVPFNVTWNMDPEAADVVDTGLRKATTDYLQTRGETNVVVLAAALRLVMLYDTVPYEAGAWHKARMSNEQVRHMLEAEPTIREACNAGPALKSIMLPSAASASLHLAGRHWPADTVAEFFDKLRSGAGLEKGEAVNALREALINQKVNRKYVRSGSQQLAMFIKAWNFHVTGKGRTQLAWRAHEPFPKILTPDETNTRAAR